MMTRVTPIIRQFLAALACVALVSCATDQKQEPLSTTLQGRLMPGVAPGSMQFKTESSGVYTLVSNRMSSALFIDTNLLTKTLLFKGRALPERKFEVTGNLHSVHDGHVHELYYFCEVCVIKGIDPGPCMCCREPVVLREEPEAAPKSEKAKPK